MDDLYTLYSRKILADEGIYAYLRFLAAGQFHPALIRQWLALTERTIPPAMKYRLAQKPFRPYMRGWFAYPARMRMMLMHYQYLEANLAPRAFNSMTQENGVAAARLMAKNAASYSVFMGGATTKEGEMAFTFVDNASGQILATVRGTLGQEEQGKPVFWIGALQGAKPPAGRDEIVQATRALNGLRPKQAVMCAACAFSEWAGAESLIAPARVNHIAMRGWRRWQAALFGKRRILSDYDEFWLELGGKRSHRGDYILPVIPPARNVEDVKSKKRKEWLKRHERLKNIRQDTLMSLAAMAPAPETPGQPEPGLSGAF